MASTSPSNTSVAASSGKKTTLNSTTRSNRSFSITNPSFFNQPTQDEEDEKEECQNGDDSDGHREAEKEPFAQTSSKSDYSKGSVLAKLETNLENKDQSKKPSFSLPASSYSPPTTPSRFPSASSQKPPHRQPHRPSVPTSPITPTPTPATPPSTPRGILLPPTVSSSYIDAKSSSNFPITSLDLRLQNLLSNDSTVQSIESVLSAKSVEWEDERGLGEHEKRRQRGEERDRKRNRNRKERRDRRNDKGKAKAMATSLSGEGGGKIGLDEVSKRWLHDGNGTGNGFERENSSSSLRNMVFKAGEAEESDDDEEPEEDYFSHGKANSESTSPGEDSRSGSDSDTESDSNSVAIASSSSSSPSPSSPPQASPQAPDSRLPVTTNLVGGDSTNPSTTDAGGTGIQSRRRTVAQRGQGESPAGHGDTKLVTPPELRLDLEDLQSKVTRPRHRSIPNPNLEPNHNNPTTNPNPKPDPNPNEDVTMQQEDPEGSGLSKRRRSSLRPKIRKPSILSNRDLLHHRRHQQLSRGLHHFAPDLPSPLASPTTKVTRQAARRLNGNNGERGVRKDGETKNDVSIASSGVNELRPQNDRNRRRGDSLRRNAIKKNNVDNSGQPSDATTTPEIAISTSNIDPDPTPNPTPAAQYSASPPFSPGLLTPTSPFGQTPPPTNNNSTPFNHSRRPSAVSSKAGSIYDRKSRRGSKDDKEKDERLRRMSFASSLQDRLAHVMERKKYPCPVHVAEHHGQDWLEKSDWVCTCQDGDKGDKNGESEFQREWTKESQDIIPGNNNFAAIPADDDIVSHQGSMDPFRSVRKRNSSRPVASEADTEAGTQIFDKKRTGWRLRLRHYTFATFSANMATGGLTILARSIPFPFRGQHTMGLVFFFINLLIFLVNVSCIVTRFLVWRKDFMRAITHPREGMFVPASCLALCLLLQDILVYLPSSVPAKDLSDISLTFFIFYLTIAVLFGYGTPFIMFTYPSHSLATMLPAWILSIYPLLLVGTLASTVIPMQLGNTHQLWMLEVSLAFSGMGFLVAQLYLASFILRLVQYGLPRPAETPSIFIAAGVPSLTATSLVKLSTTGMTVFAKHNFLGMGQLAGQVIHVMCVIMGLFYLLMGWWFAGIGLMSLVRAIHKGMRFSLTWWSCIFPLVNLATGVFAYGQPTALNSHFLNVVGTVLATALYLGWAWILLCQLWAIWTERIMHPQAGDENYPIYRFADLKSGNVLPPPLPDDNKNIEDHHPINIQHDHREVEGGIENAGMMETIQVDELNRRREKDVRDIFGFTKGEQDKDVNSDDDEDDYIYFPQSSLNTLHITTKTNRKETDMKRESVHRSVD